MKKESLLKQYMNNPEAREFIEKHKRELKPLSYECDELSHFKSVVVRMEDISMIIQNIPLLKDKYHQKFMVDYYNGMSLKRLMEKYGYKNIETTRTTVHKFKKTILARAKKKADRDFAFEMKKVSQTYLKTHSLTRIELDLNGRAIPLVLVRVAHKHKLNYKYTDEDCLTMRNKFAIIKKYCSTLELKKIEKMGDLMDLKPHQFNFVSEILNRFRWVNYAGYLLNKNIDDALTDILSVEETRENTPVLN